MDEVLERGPGVPTGRVLKRRLRGLLADGELEEIAGLAAADHRVLGSLIALTYDGEARIAWRAIEALGRGADRLTDVQPDAVRNYLRRLFWLITEESGGICWFAPQGMAEIVSRRPERFGDFIPITVNLLGEMADEDLEHFRPGILWAIGRLGPLAADHLDLVGDRVEAALGHPDPQVRGLAVWALAGVGRTAPLAERPALLDDGSRLRLYGDSDLATTTVAELTRRALGRV